MIENQIRSVLDRHVARIREYGQMYLEIVDRAEKDASHVLKTRERKLASAGWSRAMAKERSREGASRVGGARVSGWDRQLLGVPETSPLVEEQLAIDATFALRGAESGIRSLRSRSLLRRLWEGVTGDAQELESSVGADLLAAQRATLGMVRTVMREEGRTQRLLRHIDSVKRPIDTS